MQDHIGKDRRMNVIGKRAILIATVLISTIGLLGGATRPSQAQLLRPLCPYGRYYSDGLCYAYSWAGAAVPSSLSAPAVR